MKVLRHEEFEKGCEAACNGPYDGKWSKTMIGKKVFYTWYNFLYISSLYYGLRHYKFTL